MTMISVIPKLKRSGYIIDRNGFSGLRKRNRIDKNTKNFVIPVVLFGFFARTVGYLRENGGLSLFLSAKNPNLQAEIQKKTEPMRTDLIVFDLDGTLLDTIGDLAVACNAMLALRRLPEHSYDDYRHFVGNGILRLVERALPEELRTPEYVAAARADFVAYYTEHIDLHTVPYAGIPELLDALRAQGVRLAVASNKFQAGTEKLIRRFFPDVPFDAVLGQRPDVPLKPDPAIVEEILRCAGVPRERVLYVGDSGIDMQTAAAARIRSVGVTWGFRSREELQQAGAGALIDRSEELLRLL